MQPRVRVDAAYVRAFTLSSTQLPVGRANRVATTGRSAGFAPLEDAVEVARRASQIASTLAAYVMREPRNTNDVFSSFSASLSLFSAARAARPHRRRPHTRVTQTTQFVGIVRRG